MKNKFVSSPGQPPATSPARLAIYFKAREEIGKVSDHPGKVGSTGWVQTKAAGSIQQRYGWQRLKHYMDRTMKKPPQWHNTTTLPFTSHTGITHYITQLEGVKCVNMRPPLYNVGAGGKPVGGKWNGVHWCGIFAAWILQEIGFSGVHWGDQQLLTSGGKLETYQPSQHVAGQVVNTLIDWSKAKQVFAGEYPLTTGDICVLHGGQNHHVIFKGYGPNKTFDYIAGNELYQEIQEISGTSLTKIYRIYHVWPDYAV